MGSEPASVEREAAAGVRLAAGIAAALALLFVVAVSPVAGALSIPLVAVAAAALAHPEPSLRAARAALLLVVVLAAALVAAVKPGAAAAVAPVAIAAGVWWRWPALFWAVVRVAGVAALGFALWIWPATVALVALVAGIAVLARRAPLTALGVAVLLYGFEGSVKILLGLETTPLPGGNRAAGAFLLDLGLLAAIAGILLDDRLATPRAFWARGTRAERRVVALLGVWLALSVLQMAQGGEISRGLHGFRLFQAYAAMAVVGAVVFAKPELRLRAARGLLAIGFAVSLYAAFRVIAGPARSEVGFATSVETVTAYGQAFRAVGSFSSAVGLSSFLAPLVAFALVAGYLLPRLRTLAWVTGGLALVGLIGSYGRASLFGIAFGLLCALVLMLLAADVPPRRKLAAAGLVVLVLAGAYGGVQAASHASPQLRERAQGILNPFDDPSMKLRFKNWRHVLAEVGHSPLGHGVGSVGGASSPDRTHVVTTDNSFLKVLFEQGVLGAAFFLAGMVAAVVGIGRRLRWAGSDERGLGLAALAGFVTFLGISMTGEYVEQPGKVLAWGLLGIAAAQVLGGRLSPTREREVVA